MSLSNDTSLKKQIEDARERTLSWFHKLQAESCVRGVSRVSGAHDAQRWPGVLLPGTYNATMGRALLGDIPQALSAAERQQLAQWFLSHRHPDGRFYLHGMDNQSVYKKESRIETWRYIDFHITNYCLGALEFIAPELEPLLDFVDPWLDPLYLKAWLAERDLRDPWQEGNNIVNLASFLLLLKKQKSDPRADIALREMFAWHYRLQEPSTGFWGLNQSHDRTAALHAMAGSMHNFHLWYATGETLPYQDKAVDYSLTQTPEIVSACIDVDLVDLLIHAKHTIHYRETDIDKWLRALLPQLLELQNADGGFPDTRSGTWRPDGWVKGYEEPQGISNTFATWFRWIAIAMIADSLWPGWKTWHFRRMIGIGYRHP